ncbi:MAG: DUF1573 domain-containing protein, partial [Planctomycetota bacterium]|nr:DUF1573 domain-containing protein [Planctomycetota bacterium]
MNRPIGIITCFSVILSCGLPVWAENSRSDETRSKQFGKKNQYIATRTHDFGTVARGAKAVHRFKIINPHGKPLVIENIRSSCGCTKPSLTTKIIQPGDAGWILAEFNTRS